MPRPAVCPHCREELDIPAELRGREVRCAVCRNTFVPDAADPADTPPPRATRSRPQADPTDEFEPRPRRRAGLSWVWILVLGGFGCCGLGCGGFVLLGVYVAFPDFQPFDSAEGRFHADFPGTPTQFTDISDEARPRQNTEFKRKFPPETYFVRYVDLPAAVAKASGPALNDACDKLVRRAPGSKEESRSEVKMVGGNDAIDITIRNPDNTVTVARAVLADRRLYVVGMTGGGLKWDTPHVQHFMDAFRVTPPDPDEPAAKKADPAEVAPGRKNERPGKKK